MYAQVKLQRLQKHRLQRPPRAPKTPFTEAPEAPEAPEKRAPEKTHEILNANQKILPENECHFLIGSVP